MAAIPFTCPHCGKSLFAPQISAGRSMPCPCCRQELQIPGTSVEAGRTTALPLEAPAQPAGTVQYESVAPPPPISIRPGVSPPVLPPPLSPNLAETRIDEREIERTASPLTPAVSPLRGDGAETAAVHDFDAPSHSGDGFPAVPATDPAGADDCATTCGICLSPIYARDLKTACPDCAADYHAECWQENGGCAVYGCAQVPAIEKRNALEIPVSYWGQEHKPCPACGKEILAAAMRCRHCGAIFSSARPEQATEFQQRSALQQRLPSVRRQLIVVFVICLLPCLAPLGVIWGLLWYPKHREEVNTLPSLYPALYKIGIGVGIGQTVMIITMGLLWTARSQF